MLKGRVNKEARRLMSACWNGLVYDCRVILHFDIGNVPAGQRSVVQVSWQRRRQCVQEDSLVGVLHARIAQVVLKRRGGSAEVGMSGTIDIMDSRRVRSLDGYA